MPACQDEHSSEIIRNTWRKMRKNTLIIAGYQRSGAIGAVAKNPRAFRLIRTQTFVIFML
jgi:hypothetical protein